MAAVSFPSPNRAQIEENLPLTKKLRFSDVPSSYTQICPLEGAQELVVNVVMHTIKNICIVKDRQQREYFVSGAHENMKVVMAASGREVTILGYDFKLGVFFSQNPNGIRFYQMIKNFTQPPTEEQSKSIATEKKCQYYPQKIREDMANLIKDTFRFAPPRIVCDVVEENKMGGAQPLTKCLPLEAATSEALLKEFVYLNRGLFLGHNHEDITEIGIFFENLLAQLSQWGVKHFYLELPAASLHQQFALFNHNDPKNNSIESKALEEALKKRQVSDYKEILKICLLAKKHGIEVWPVDETFERLSEMNSLERAVTGRDRIISKNVRYYSSLLKKEEKYICLYGAMHYQVDLAIPKIRIELCQNLQKLEYVSKVQEEGNQSPGEGVSENRGKVTQLDELKKIYEQLSLANKHKFQEIVKHKLEESQEERNQSPGERVSENKEVITQLNELQKNLYEQLSFEDKLKFATCHGYDAILTLFKENKEFILKLLSS